MSALLDPGLMGLPAGLSPRPGSHSGAMMLEYTAHAAAADSFNQPSITLDQARLTTGEVFINGQHEPTNRPKPIARAANT